VTIQTVYDRSGLIHRAIETLKGTLIEESLIVALVCAVFLLHLRSALVAILMLPVGVLIAFIIMHGMGLNANIMSLGGIAIAIGAMVDAAIVMIENTHKHLERSDGSKSRLELVSEACREVGPALFFSLLIITVSFLPVFTLEAQEGRLFSPLAFTKTFSMAGAALLSVTLVPVLMLLFVRGKILPERKNPVNRLLIWIYRPVINTVLRWQKTTIALALLVLAVTLVPLRQLGSEFMPALNEGTLLYMPATLPGLSVTKAAELMQTQDRIIKSFPEVESVFGKAGRANTATDPAPVEMFETIINLKPEAQWRAGMTTDKLIAELDKALQMPGVANAWTMPIKARTDMLSTGIRTPIGIKVYGKDLGEIEALSKQIESVVKQVPGTTSAYAERVTGGYYLDITPDREVLARYGLAIGDVQDVIATAMGGEMVTTTVEGRERYGVGVRYPRELRSDPEAIATQILVPTPSGAMVPLGQLAQIALTKGAPKHSHRKCAAVRLHLCRYSRQRYRWLRACGAESRQRAGQIQAWLLHRLERAVRIHGTRQSQAENRDPADIDDHFPAALSQLPPHYRNPDRHVIGAVRAGRRRLADVAIGLQHERCGSGRLHCPGWRCRRNRRGDVDLSRPRLARDSSATPAGRQNTVDRRPLRRGDGRCRRAGTAKNDDGGRYHGRPVANHVEHRHRFGSDAPYCRANGRRHGVVHFADSVGDSSDLYAGQAAEYGSTPITPIEPLRLEPRGSALPPRLQCRSFRGENFPLNWVPSASFTSTAMVAFSAEANWPSPVSCVPAGARSTTSFLPSSNTMAAPLA
jgi:Cu(I)/Ag(I) efflux system membrane protein CusA/SilA